MRNILHVFRAFCAFFFLLKAKQYYWRDVWKLEGLNFYKTTSATLPKIVTFLIS